MEKKSRFRRFLTRVGSVRLNQIWDKFRKPFNFCWKAGLAIFAIVFVIQLGEALIDTCKDHLGLTHYYWGDEDLGKNIEVSARILRIATRITKSTVANPVALFASAGRKICRHASMAA